MYSTRILVFLAIAIRDEHFTVSPMVKISIGALGQLLAAPFVKLDHGTIDPIRAMSFAKRVPPHISWGRSFTDRKRRKNISSIIHHPRARTGRWFRTMAFLGRRAAKWWIAK